MTNFFALYILCLFAQGSSFWSVKHYKKELPLYIPAVQYFKPACPWTCNQQRYCQSAYQICNDVMVTFYMFPHTDSLQRKTDRERQFNTLGRKVFCFALVLFLCRLKEEQVISLQPLDLFMSALTLQTFSRVLEMWYLEPSSDDPSGQSELIRTLHHIRRLL